MIVAGSMTIFRILAASAALVLLSGCGETTRSIGFLSSPGAGGDGAAGQGNGSVGDSALPASACQSLGHCGGDLQRSDATQVPSALGGTEWVATAPDACQEQLPTQEAYDACDKVRPSVDGGVTGGLMYPLLPFEHALVIVPGSDGSSFDLHFRASAHLAMFFSATCRAGWAVALSCPALGRRIYESTVAESNVRGLRCADDEAEGAAAPVSYQLTQFFDVPCVEREKNGVISLVNHNNLSSPVAPVDYCVQGDTLELSGHDDQMLFNPAFSVRTLRASSADVYGPRARRQRNWRRLRRLVQNRLPGLRRPRAKRQRRRRRLRRERVPPTPALASTARRIRGEERRRLRRPLRLGLLVSQRQARRRRARYRLAKRRLPKGRFSDSDPIACPH